MGYYAEQGNNIAGTLQSDFAKLATVAATGSHLANQKEANIEAASARVDQANINKKLGEFDLQQNTEDIKKAQTDYNTAFKKQEELQGNLNKAQESYDTTQRLAYDYDDEGQRAIWESKDAKGRAKGELKKQAEESWNLRDETRAQLKEKGYDISKAREALDNQIQVAKGKEFIFNQAKLRREELLYKDKLNSEAITKAEARYKKVGGK